MAQKKYGMIINTKIQSVFYSDKPKSAYPDIQHLLVELEDYMDCNDYLIGGEFYEREEIEGEE